MFISEFVSHLRPLQKKISDDIFHYGEFPASVYFIVKGRVHFVIGPKKTVYKTMTTGSYFGEIELIAKIPRTTETKAGTNLDLLTISKQNFEQIMLEYPEYAQEIHQIAKKRNHLMKQSIKKIKRLIPISKDSTFWFKQRNESLRELI